MNISPLQLLVKLYCRFLQEWSNATREKYARLVGVHLGQGCCLYSTNFGSEPYMIAIGNHVTVTEGVRFITHDGGLRVFRHEYPSADYIRPIIVYDNCFIGVNTIILPGVTIGPNAVIGAGSVVSHSIPANCIAAGSPARVISTLEEYRRHIDKDLFIHHMNKAQKKAFLLNYFGDSPERWLMYINDNERGNTEST